MRKDALQDLKDFLFRKIADLGWAPQEQLARLAQEEMGADALSVHQALRFLVRQDYVTVKEGPDGQKGYEVLPPTSQKGRQGARYGQWSPITVVTATFITHCLAPMTRPGDDTHFFFPRIPDGRIIIPRANIIAMLKRAWLLLDKEDGVAQAALKRWDVYPVLFPQDAAAETVVRRVVRPDGRTTEPLYHEAIGPGTRFSLRFRYPQSHFSKALVLELLDVAARSVGLSPAGGANGRWGLFTIDDIAEAAMAA